jgi:TM2 domain-containing membrane protein YozV
MRLANLLSGVVCGVIGAILTALSLGVSFYISNDSLLFYQMDSSTNLAKFSILSLPFIIGLLVAIIATSLISLAIGTFMVSFAAAAGERKQNTSSQSANLAQTPIVPADKFCSSCGEKIKAMAEICPKCGVRQQLPQQDSKKKTTAAIFALLLGGIGIHKFYLGRPIAGILYIVFFWTCIPAIIGLIEGIIYLTMTDSAFQQKYGAQ